MIIVAFPHRDISGTKCDFSVQVQLRFCLSETSCPQEDHFPPNLCVKVNGKPCNLPVRSPGLLAVCRHERLMRSTARLTFLSDFQGYLPPTKNGVEPKRPSRPINITSLVRLSTTVPNTIVVSWTAEIGRVGAKPICPFSVPSGGKKPHSVFQSGGSEKILSVF